jgi:predicted nuclease with TOPRIM domain
MSAKKPTDTDARKKLIAELAAERDELERKAAERERQAQRLQASQKSAALLEVRNLRQQANAVGRRWSDLTDAELHDDDRGGIER